MERFDCSALETGSPALTLGQSFLRLAQQLAEFHDTATDDTMAALASLSDAREFAMVAEAKVAEVHLADLDRLAAERKALRELRGKP